jgi:hypothetical protein
VEEVAMSADADPRTALLRRELAKEADAGFPHLSTIPATGVVQFVDYCGDLDAKHRAALLDDLARHAACYVDRVAKPPSAAIDRMRAALKGPSEFVGGWRYTDVRFLASVPKIPQFGGMEAWLRSYGARAQQPRADLIPDTEKLVPAKAPLLRKLANAVLEGGGYESTAMGGSMRYLSADRTLVDVDFGSRLGQLRWSVALGAMKATHGLVELPFFSYEGFWGLASDWDVLTEENAQRCVARLPALVREAVRLHAAARKAG